MQSNRDKSRNKGERGGMGFEDLAVNEGQTWAFHDSVDIVVRPPRIYSLQLPLNHQPAVMVEAG